MPTVDIDSLVADKQKATNDEHPSASGMGSDAKQQEGAAAGIDLEFKDDIENGATEQEQPFKDAEGGAAEQDEGGKPSSTSLPSVASSVQSRNTQLEFKKGCAGGFRRDIWRRLPYYKSDWTDAFTDGNMQQSTASILFLFFACLAPAIAFGTIYDDLTDGQMGVVECILASGFAGVVYSITSGQPLCILGGTGPNLAYTVAFYKICKSMDVDFLNARVWQGIWCSVLTIIFAVTDASALMWYVTRYTEEIFSALISLIFIVSAITQVIDTYYKKSEAGAFLTTILCFATYILAMQFRAMKSSKLGNPFIRKTIGNFAVTLAIAISTAVAQIWNNVDIEMLAVPEEIVPSFTKADGKSRDWFVSPFGNQGLNEDGIKRDLPVWVIFATIIPGLGMALLNYLDQNLTTKLINRKSNGLKKPGGYHLDMMVLGVIIYPVVSIFGLPFPCAATVRSLTHLISLTTYEERPIPGGGSQRVVAKVIEQRWTHFMIHLMLGLSLFASSILKEIPKGVLFGVFLYMGVTSIPGNQLFDRMLLLVKFDPKTYPKLPYVTRLETNRLHKFTLFQVLMLAILYALKASPAAMGFPFFIAALIFVRRSLDRWFTKAELKVLDAEADLPPDPPDWKPPVKKEKKEKK